MLLILVNILYIKFKRSNPSQIFLTCNFNPFCYLLNPEIQTDFYK